MEFQISLPGITLKNTLVYNGSGSFEYGKYQWTEFAKEFCFNGLDVVVLKTSTLESRITPEPRANLLYDNGNQVINSIGLQNPPISGVIKKIAEFNKTIGKPLIASASGNNIKEFAKNVKILSEQNIAAIEINLSCPNVDKGGITFGIDPKMVQKVVRACKQVSNKPIYVKLTPNVTDISKIAIAAEKGGADAIVAINTLLGFMVDPKSGKPVVARGYGGYSGPGILPVALRAVHQIYKVVKIPIIGIGGISKPQDVIDMLSAGASACQIVTGSKTNKNYFADFNKQVNQKLQTLKITDIKSLIGRSHRYKPTQVLPKGNYSH